MEFEQNHPSEQPGISLFRDAAAAARTTTSIEEDPLGRALQDAIILAAKTTTTTTVDDVSGGNGVVSTLISAEEGRGLVATKAIKQGQVVVCVPWDAVITPHRAASQSSLRPLLLLHNNTPLLTLPDWTVLAVWLAEVIHSSTSYDNNESDPSAQTPLAAAYAAVLPKSRSTGCVLEWSDSEVSWLKGSPLHKIAQDIRTAAATSWAEVQPVIQHAEREGMIDRGVLTEETVRHAFSLLLSRLIRLDNVPGEEASLISVTDGETTVSTPSPSTVESNTTTTTTTASVDVLCPWADFVNHDSHSTSFLHFDSTQNCVTLRADRARQPGEQIYASYGQKTSGELLLSYGFLPDFDSNPHNGFLLQIDLQHNARKNREEEEETKLKKAALERRGLDDCRIFPLRMGALPNGMLQFAAFVAAPVQTAPEADALCEELFGGNSEESMRGELRERGVKAVVDLCKQSLQRYSIGMEAAKIELEELQKSSSSSSSSSSGVVHRLRRRMDVLKVLVYEQKVLSRLSFLLQQQLRKKPR